MSLTNDQITAKNFKTFYDAIRPYLGSSNSGSDSSTPVVTRSKKIVDAEIPRWLRFDPENRQGLIIKANTSIKLLNGEYVDYDEDYEIDLSSENLVGGKDYFIYLNNDETFTCSDDGSLTTGRKIGRFHTLCVNAGTMTMIAPASPSSGLTTSDTFLVKSYREDRDPDFYAFYNKPITAVSAGTPYDVITCTHPLSGYEAGDILPESIFCLTWYPDTLKEDAMVYDKDTDVAIDVYLQSGTGLNTTSKYNVTHTVSRQPWNHHSDMIQVGKHLLSDAEFTSMSIGSNQATNISGSADATTVGGHVDMNNRRMISAIGVEEACGYLWQWLDEFIGWVDDKWCDNEDGRDAFGKTYRSQLVVAAGGTWDSGSKCGSRSRNSYNPRRRVDAYYGGRGSSQVVCLI